MELQYNYYKRSRGEQSFFQKFVAFLSNSIFSVFLQSFRSFFWAQQLFPFMYDFRRFCFEQNEWK